MKNKNGITLIALIITIIVMLVLAGVAISSVVGENGVIEKAETANVKMEEKEILEQVQTSSTYKLNGNIDLKQTYDNIEKLFGEDKINLISPTDKADITDTTSVVEIEVEGKKGKYSYTIGNKSVDKYKGIKLDKDQLIFDFVSGETITEEITATLINIEGNIEWTVEDENIVTISSSNNSATITIVSPGTTTITAKCGEYTSKCNIKVNVKLKVGDIVYYDGTDSIEGKEEWIVYEVGEEILEIISKQTIGSIYMGYKYEDIDDYKAVDLDGDGSISEQEKALYSFNNAVEIINYCCKKYVTATDNDGVRSIGGKPYDKAKFEPTTYNKSNWFKNNIVYKGDTYKDEANSKLNNVIGTTIEIKGGFWYASKHIDETSRYVTGYLYTGSSWQYSKGEAWNVNSSGELTLNKKVSGGMYNSKGVLPIVTNPKNISLEP